MSYITRRIKRLGNKEVYKRFFDTLKYSLYVIFHPADGMWDLIHAKRGSYAAANFIVIMTLLTHLWKLQFTSFLFIEINWEKENVFMQMATILLPLAIFCICNWACTTLFDGKGHLGDVYMGTAYALTPYVLIQIPLIILSHFITRDGGSSFYDVFNNISIYWTAMLIFMAMMIIHQYGFGKTLLFTFITFFGMLVFIFIMLLFFSMISQGVGYFVALAREIMFRLN